MILWSLVIGVWSFTCLRPTLFALASLLDRIHHGDEVSPRPTIFVSAVSRELNNARQLVANTLTFLGYQPIWQNIFGTESGDLRQLLRQQIDHCKGVVQLVGRCYGAEPPIADGEFGRVSYTQYEALYARQRGKKVWYLFIDENFPVNPCDPEPPELRDLQTAYRRRLQADTHLFHPLSSNEALEASVLRLRDDLTRLRRGVKQWAVGVVLLLLLIAGLTSWLVHAQRQTRQEMSETKKSLAAMSAEMAKLHQGIMDYSRTETRLRGSETVKDPAAMQQLVYAELAKQLNLDPKLLREKLPRLAEELKQAPQASNYERANAAYVANDYLGAEQLALQAADQAAKATPPNLMDTVRAWTLAGLAAQKHVEFGRAMEHFREAEKLTDQVRSPREWAEVQHAIANLLLAQGQYRDAENIVRVIVDVRTHLLGPEDPDTLRSRSQLGTALWRQGKYAEAEANLREIIMQQEKVLGPEHPDTLRSRHSLAVALDEQRKYTEAETEDRQVLTLREKVLGPEHPETLQTRGELAIVLQYEEKYTQAESEDRELLKIRTRVLGPEHPDTLLARGNLVSVLQAEGKLLEAEKEDRQVIKLSEKVLGPEHPDTLTMRRNLANVLRGEGNYPKSEAELREVINLSQKVLGREHRNVLAMRNELAWLLVEEGKDAEAEAEIQPVIELEEKSLGKEDAETLISRDTLSVALEAQGKYADAESEYKSLIKLEEKVFGPENTQTLGSRIGFGKTLMDQGKDAEADMREAIKLREKAIGPEHSDMLASYYDFASGLKHLGKIKEAKELAQKATDGARKVLGPDHPSTRKYEKLLQDLEPKP